METLRALLLALAAGLASAAEPSRARPGFLALSRRLSHRAREPPSVHFLYTTGCNDYQLLHSVVLDYSWKAVGNKGRLSRVVSGCKSAEDHELLTRSPLRDSPEFSVFIAKGDDLDKIPATGERYPARARPHAIQQWMDSAAPAEDVICLIDPDFAWLRPVSSHPSLAKVRPGRMVSSSGWEWFGDESGHDIPAAFKTGPVWLIATSDLRTILPEWQSLTDTWKKVGDGLMREQFAFQASAQKHNIPADFVEDFATELLGEAYPRAEPYAIHYFRSYKFGEWGFHKSLASSGWYADHFNNSVPPPTRCGAPLLQEPPAPPKHQDEALTMYKLLPRMNAGIKAYRELYCSGEREAFERQGPSAFGLVRLMHPIGCPSQVGELTRYRVEPSQPASWEAEQALGGKRCSQLAQMLPAAPKSPQEHMLAQLHVIRREHAAA